MSTITAAPQAVHLGASSILTFKGPANVSVAWYVDGDAVISPRSAATDAQGVAVAILEPTAAPGTAIVRVRHG